MSGRFVLGSSSSSLAVALGGNRSSCESSAMGMLSVDTMLSINGDGYNYNTNVNINVGCGGTSGDSGGSRRGRNEHRVMMIKSAPMTPPQQPNCTVDLDSDNSSDDLCNEQNNNNNNNNVVSLHQQQGFIDLSSDILSPFYNQIIDASNNSWSCVSPSSYTSSSNASSPGDYFNYDSVASLSSSSSPDGSCMLPTMMMNQYGDDASIKLEKREVVMSTCVQRDVVLNENDMIEPNSVSDALLSEISSMESLYQLPLADLELLEREMPASLVSELKAFTPPPSPPLTPPHLLTIGQQQSIESNYMDVYKTVMKNEPIDMDYKPSMTPESSPQPAMSPALSVTSMDSIVPQTPPEQKRRYPNTKDCLHVAEFLCNLLRESSTLIKWEKKEKGLFRILKPKEVATLWARAKSNKETMNYPNMARGIRFARVKSGDFELVTKEDGVGKKLVYKFSQRFRARNPWLSSFMHPY